MKTLFSPLLLNLFSMIFLDYINMTKLTLDKILHLSNVVIISDGNAIDSYLEVGLSNKDGHVEFLVNLKGKGW